MYFCLLVQQTFSIPLFDFLCLYLSVYVLLQQTFFELSLSLSLSLFLSLYLSACLLISLTNYLYLSFFVSLFPSFSLSPYLSFILSILYLSLSYALVLTVSSSNTPSTYTLSLAQLLHHFHYFTDILSALSLLHIQTYPPKLPLFFTVFFTLSISASHLCTITLVLFNSISFLWSSRSLCNVTTSWDGGKWLQSRGTHLFKNSHRYTISSTRFLREDSLTLHFVFFFLSLLMSAVISHTFHVILHFI